MLAKIGEWLGEKASDFFGWLLGGLGQIFEAIFDGLLGVFDVLDAVWNFFVGILDAVGSLLRIVIPFLPDNVSAVISSALLVVIIIGAVKLIRK